MALIFGSLHAEATHGEELTLSSLRRLPDEWLVWPELPVQGRGPRLHPDFILLHRAYGLTVLEVKDWAQILSANPNEVTVRTRDGSHRTEKNPIDTAQRYCYAILDMIESAHKVARRDRAFRGPKHDIPWACGVVLVRQTGRVLGHLENRLRAQGMLLGESDLKTADLEARLRRLHRRESRSI
jgi:hypothetical protein